MQTPLQNVQNTQNTQTKDAPKVEFAREQRGRRGIWSSMRLQRRQIKFRGKIKQKTMVSMR